MEIKGTLIYTEDFNGLRFSLYPGGPTYCSVPVEVGDLIRVEGKKDIYKMLGYKVSVHTYSTLPFFSNGLTLEDLIYTSRKGLEITLIRPSLEVKKMWRAM